MTFPEVGSSMEIPICFFFFILKLFRSQLIEIIDRMNIGVYEKTEQKHPFCSCSGIWESSHQTVILLVLRWALVRVLFTVLYRPVTDNNSSSFSCVRTNTVQSC